MQKYSYIANLCTPIHEIYLSKSFPSHALNLLIKFRILVCDFNQEHLHQYCRRRWLINTQRVARSQGQTVFVDVV